MSYIVKTGLAAIGLAAAASVQATPILTGSEQSLQSIINTLHTGDGAPNVQTDQLPNDELWSFADSGMASVMFHAAFAGNAGTNVFGIYDAMSANLVPLFNGATSTAAHASVSLFDDGSLSVSYANGDGPAVVQNYGVSTFGGNQFGFYLGTSGGVFYSEQARNALGADQLVAYQGPSSGYTFAWEDLVYGSSDKDFNDLVVSVDGVRPTSVPEPGTLALMGLGLIGIAFASRRRAV